MKNIQFFWVMLCVLSSQLSMSQQGSISLVSYPSELTAGDTVQITFAYTSSVNGFYEIQFIPLKANGSPIWNANVTFDRGPVTITTAGRSKSVTISVEIPIDVSGTEELTGPAAAWGWFGKLDTSLEDSGDDYAFLDPYPETTVFPASEDALSVQTHLQERNDFYFNPTTKELRIHDVSDVERLELYTINGRLIRIEEYANKNHTINLSDLGSGMYVARINHNHIKLVL